MTKREFLDTLQSVLTDELGIAIAEDNVKYYNDYIEQKKREGLSEQDVLDELGSPRLIAKSIIDSHMSDDNMNSNYGREHRYKFDNDYESNSYSSYDENKKNLYEENTKSHSISNKIHKIFSSILGALVILLVVFVIVSIIGGLITITVNVLVPVLAVLILIGAVIGIINGFTKRW